MRCLTELVHYPVAGLVPLVGNPNAMTREELERLKASLLVNGLLENLVVQAGTRVVVGGNHRLLALKELVDEGKLNEDFVVPCGEWDFTEDEVRRIAVALNRISGDLSALALQQFLAGQVFESELDLNATGLSTEDWDLLQTVPWDPAELFSKAPTHRRPRTPRPKTEQPDDDEPGPAENEAPVEPGGVTSFAHYCPACGHGFDD